MSSEKTEQPRHELRHAPQGQHPDVDQDADKHQDPLRHTRPGEATKRELSYEAAQRLRARLARKFH